MGKKKPLDPSGKKCRKCGAGLTVIRVQHWGRICQRCKPAEDRRVVRATMEQRREVILASERLQKDGGYPPKAWVRRWLSPAGAARHFEIRRLLSRFEPGRNLSACLFPRRSKFYDMLMRHCQRGDRICFFRSPEETWVALCGREGYAIFRHSEVVKAFTTALN